MKKGRLVFKPATGKFVTVESPAAMAKRHRKERERALAERQANGTGTVTGAVAKSGSSSGRRKNGFRGGMGLYYLLAAIEFVETS